MTMRGITNKTSYQEHYMSEYFSIECKKLDCEHCTDISCECHCHFESAEEFDNQDTGE